MLSTATAAMPPLAIAARAALAQSPGVRGPGRGLRTTIRYRMVVSIRYRTELPGKRIHRPQRGNRMKITNRHERVLMAPPERIAPLIPDFDRISPTEIGPPPPLVEGRLY